jgi:hypothetical protein
MFALSSRSLFVVVSASLLLASGPANARGFGGGHSFAPPPAAAGAHAVAQSAMTEHAFTSPARAQPIAGRGGGLPISSTSTGGTTTTTSSGPGKGSGHHHRSPPAGGSTSSSSAASGSGAAIVEQSTPAATSSSTPPVTANMARDSALTGGTDPAIGQSSPPVPDVFASGGGPAVTDHSGGGANTLASCMSFWDSATHMSKPEWRATCVRTLNGIDLPADGGMTAPPSTRAHVRHMRTRTPVTQ